MKYMIILLLALILPAISWASDPVPTESPSISQDELQKAMIAAQKEYEQTLSAREAHAGVEKRKLEELVSELATRQKPQEREILTSLARQVDELKNRLIIERATLLSTQSPKSVKVRGARTVFHYQEDAVYQVTSAIDYITDIALKPGERLTTTPTAGDTVRWNIGIMESGTGKDATTHIILKPTEPKIETNLVITTNEHVYHLSLKSGDIHMPALSWSYPEDNEARIQAALYREHTTEPTVNPEHLRFNYEISGDKVSWRPVRVFDDGAKTFIQMPRNLGTGEAPVLFVLETGEDPLLVNYRIEGEYYIVDRLFASAQLVVGKHKRVLIEFDDGKNFFQKLFN